MHDSKRHSAPRLGFLSAALLCAAGNVEAASPPTIAHIGMTETSPWLSIVSDLGATNQIQTSTNLGQFSWSTLASLIVTQSPYTFIDTLSSPAPRRFYRILQVGVATNSSPTDMVFIPAGSFEMGDAFDEGAYYELPVHSVYVSAFYMDKFEVTKGLWDQVRNWSLTNGYGF